MIAKAPSNTHAWIVVTETSFQSRSCLHFSAYPAPLSRGSTSAKMVFLENLTSVNTCYVAA